MIGQELAATLPALRAQAESLMTQTGVIRERRTSQFGRTSKVMETTLGAVLYSGPMRVRGVSSRGDRSDTGEQQVTAPELMVFLPWTTTGIHPDCELTITAGGDPYLTGRTLIITAAEPHEPAVHQKFRAIDNQG